MTVFRRDMEQDRAYRRSMRIVNVAAWLMGLAATAILAWVMRGGEIG